eukprot:scaffold83937_cov66-Phaeocystis_antarctica.AAC.5
MICTSETPQLPSVAGRSSSAPKRTLTTLVECGITTSMGMANLFSGVSLPEWIQAVGLATLGRHRSAAAALLLRAQGGTSPLGHKGQPWASGWRGRHKGGRMGRCAPERFDRAAVPQRLMPPLVQRRRKAVKPAFWGGAFGEALGVHCTACAAVALRLSPAGRREPARGRLKPRWATLPLALQRVCVTKLLDPHVLVVELGIGALARPVVDEMEGRLQPQLGVRAVEPHVQLRHLAASERAVATQHARRGTALGARAVGPRGAG